jgi:hypothetical protein
MKKGIAAILITLYVAFSTGVVINYHFCMKRLDSLQIGASNAKVCGKCGMHTDDSNGCCHDEVKIFKISDDQLFAGINYKFSSPVELFKPSPLFFDEQLIVTVKNSLFNNHSPPLSKQDTYLQNCVFRI